MSSRYGEPPSTNRSSPRPTYPHTGTGGRVATRVWSVMWPTSEGRPAATACVRQPSACSVGHVVLAMAGGGWGGEGEGVHATPLAAGALSTSARETSAAAATKAFMAPVYRLVDAASRSPRGPCRILERVAPREGRRLDALSPPRRRDRGERVPI